MIVKEDLHVLFEIGGVFAPGLVHLVQNPHRHAQASRSLRPFDALLRDVHRVEDDPLAGASDRREHLVFNRIIFGTVRGIVGHPNFQPQPICQSLQVFLEQVLCGAVAAASVPQYQQPRRPGIDRAARVLPPQRHAVAAQGARVVARMEVDVRVLVHHGIDPVGNQFSLARRAEVVVERFNGLRGEGRASPVNIPQQFFLFCLEGNHRIAGRLVLTS